MAICNVNNYEVIWAPQPGSQAAFMKCPYWEVLYGGTRGGGKTDGLLMDYAQHVGQGYGPAWKGILFRQTHPQLEDIIAKTMKWFPLIFPGSRFLSSNNKYKWLFESGEQLLLRHMDRPSDYYKYHGHEYPWVGWEELTNWPTNECYESMKSTNRSSHPDPSMPRKYRATCNPWGPGHMWVKNYFIDPAQPQSKIIDLQGKSRTYIHSNIFENKVLMKYDPDYISTLQALKDPAQKAAWLEGSWDLAAGGFFEHVWNKKIIIEPFDIPESWYIGMSMDWGSWSPSSIGIWAISDGNGDTPYPRGSMIRIHEVYTAKRDKSGKIIPNKGNKATNEKLAEILSGLINDYDPFYQLADPQMFKEQGGPSIAKQLKKIDNRIRFRPADNARIAGWQTMVDMMEEAGKDHPERPGMWVFDTCRQWIRTIPALTRDEKNLEDVNTDLEDHIADESRYMCQSLRSKTKRGPLFNY